VSDVAEGEAVFRFDSLFDPAFARAPQPYFQRMRDTNPVMRTPSIFSDAGSAVFVARHDDVEQVLRDPERFSSKWAPDLPFGFPMIPLNIDPPDHLRYRRLLDPMFGPRRINAMEDDIAQRANALIDAFIERGECEFSRDFAIPLPCGVFVDLMGMPPDEIDDFIRWKEQILRGSGAAMMSTEDEVRLGAQREANDRFIRLIEERRREPRGDLLTEMLHAEFAGTRFSQEELLGILHLLLVAGLDTVTDSLSCFYAFLAQHSDHRRRIVDDPDIIPNAVEEMLRYESPVPFVPRIAAAASRLSGTNIEPGDQLVLLIGSANTDERAHDDADRVDFDREAIRHFAFGAGIHRCLGSHLARLELRVSLREWHRRIPEYRLRDGVELEFSPVLRQVEHLPLVFG
jgi:cytochrome P450